MDNPLISFVIVTRDRKDSLRRCLASVFRQTYPNKEVIVVDNNSADGTGVFVQNEFPCALLIQQPTNTGAGGGKSIGLSHAHGEFMVQIDDDTAFTDCNVGESVAAYFRDNTSVGVLNFNVVNPATHQSEQRAIPRRDKQLLLTDTHLGYFLGMGCAFRASMLRQTGYYWEKLNPYGSEEMDLSYRILEKGYEILWTEKIHIVHYESPLARPGGRRTYFETRHRLWVALRHLPWRCVITHAVLWWGYGCLIALKSNTLPDFARGIRDCIAGVPEVYAKRAVISKTTIEKLRRYSGPLFF